MTQHSETMTPATLEASLPGPLITTADGRPILEVYSLATVEASSNAVAVLSGIEVVDEPTMREAEAHLVTAHELLRTMEKRRVELKKPITDLGRAIDRVCTEAMASLDTAKRSAQGRIVAWQREQQRKAEEARKAAEEAARRAKAEQDEAEARAREEALQAAKEAEDLLGVPMAPEPTPSPLLRRAQQVVQHIPAAPVSSAVSTRKMTRLVVDDPRAVAAAYEIGGQILVRCEEATITRLLKAGVKVPGARLVEEEQAVMKGGRR